MNKKSTMNKAALQQLTNQSTAELMQWFESYPQDKFEYIPETKSWSTGQHLLHIMKMYKGINMALRLPKLVLRFKFGTRKHIEQSYQALHHIYTTEYSNNKYEAPTNVTPGHVSNKDKEILLKKIEREKELINQQVEKLSEKALSKYVIPHPYFGNYTFREFVMFLKFHNDHHLKTLNENYM